MSRFILVIPTGKSPNAKFRDWSVAEMNRAIKHWRQHFGEDALIKKDTDLNA